jgi:predicted secreted protein
MDAKVNDSRGRRVIFVSHCVLNQNAKVHGIANYQGTIREVVDILLENDVGIFQMPCPEMSYLGAMRWGYVKAQYDTPMFRRHCNLIAKQVVDQVEEYRRANYQILGFIMIDGSPVCGLKKTPWPAEPGQIWGGMVWYIPKQQFVDDRGVFCVSLQEEAARRGLSDIPYVSVPEVHEAGSFKEALCQIGDLFSTDTSFGA